MDGEAAYHTHCHYRDGLLTPPRADPGRRPKFTADRIAQTRVWQGRMPVVGG